MATNTYVALDKITVSGTSTNSVTFTSIPQTYTDLVLVVNGSLYGGANRTSFVVQLGNGSIDTGTNYSSTWVAGNGTTAVSSRYSNGTNLLTGHISEASGATIVQFMNYANTSIYKTVLARGNSLGQVGSFDVGGFVSLWRSTSAINTMKIYPNDGSFYNSGTTFSLYGIKADTNSTPKATGGVISEDSTYYYHTFGMSGTFTPLQSLTADYLVVAGGGGGGGSYGYDEYGEGGGGAGGLRSTVTATGGGGSLESALSLSAQAYTVTIGAGGAGGTAGGSRRGVNGSDSTFSTITSTGGGGGGGHDAVSGAAGGSGGGGAGSTTSSNTAGAGTANQGYAGGAGKTGAAYQGGGGGGAGAVGSAGASNGGNGGAGVAVVMPSVSTYYAGGGGGGVYNAGSPGSGGVGGGGAGAFKDNGVAGTANTGGGGGGSGNSVTSAKNGGNGGSGIVIIRYSKV